MLREQKIRLLLIISIMIFSCNINYPDIRELDYVVNYYLEPNTFDYTMDFDFAMKVLHAEEISKVVIENRNTREYIEIDTKISNSSVFSILGKNTFYFKGLKFNFFSSAFISFIADLRLFDAGMREYHKDIVINTNLTRDDLISLHKIVYKDKNIDAIKKMGNVRLSLFKVTKSNKPSTTEITDLKNIELDNTADSYLYMYYIGEKSNIFFKLK